MLLVSYFQVFAGWALAVAFALTWGAIMYRHARDEVKSVAAIEAFVRKLDHLTHWRPIEARLKEVEMQERIERERASFADECKRQGMTWWDRDALVEVHHDSRISSHGGCS